MYYYVLALVVFIFDQISKYIIVRTIPLHETRSVIGDFFVLTSYRNRGAAFSILQDQRWFFVAITFVVMLGLIWYIQQVTKTAKKLLPIGLSLILGGALGNFVDRLLFGEVVDFLQFNFHFSWFGRVIDYTYPIFNLADSAVVIGACILVLDMLLEWRSERKGAAAIGQSEVHD